MATSKQEKLRRLKHILKTLDFIRNDSEFASLPNNPTRFVQDTYDKLKPILKQISKSKNKLIWSIQISHLEIPILDQKLESHLPTVLVGGLIEGRGAEITYSTYSVCVTFTTKSLNPNDMQKSLNAPSCCLDRYLNVKRIVRRFHFDFQPQDRSMPNTHLQYGGKFLKHNIETNCHYCLEHFLEIPRVHYPPMDLALLFDLIIREFGTPLERWSQEKDWKGLVIKSQEIWWKEYWNQAAEYLNNPGGLTFHERIYAQAS